MWDSHLHGWIHAVLGHEHLPGLLLLLLDVLQPLLLVLGL